MVCSGLDRADHQRSGRQPNPIRTVYAGMKPALLFISRDECASYTELASFRHIRSRPSWVSIVKKPFASYVEAITLSPTDPYTLLVGTEAAGVVGNLDSGQTWSGKRWDALCDFYSLAVHSRVDSHTPLTTSIMCCSPIRARPVTATTDTAALQSKAHFSLVSHADVN